MESQPQVRWIALWHRNRDGHNFRLEWTTGCTLVFSHVEVDLPLPVGKESTEDADRKRDAVTSTVDRYSSRSHDHMNKLAD